MRKNISKGKTALVLWGATDLGPPHFSGDMLWRAGFKAPDPFILVEVGGKVYLLLSSLELERAAKESKKNVIAVNAIEYASGQNHYLVAFLKEKGVRVVNLPETFPMGLGLTLEQNFEILFRSAPFYPKRAVKTDWEIKEIEKAQNAVEFAVQLAVNWLREATICFNLSVQNVAHLQHKGLGFHEPVASKHVRKIIDNALYEKGYLGIDTIVSCGVEAANPHCVGSGLLFPYQPIVMDVFPLSLETHYYADMTRTAFKGDPSEPLKDMYEEVRVTQEWAIRQVKHGADGFDIYKGVLDHFTAVGYPTNCHKRPMEGFIHGVGHGVGLDIHEEPNIYGRPSILKEGNVVTVEPGLYYQKERKQDGIPAGGIRIEDMVLVTKTGCRNLTKFPKDLESMIIP